MRPGPERARFFIVALLILSSGCSQLGMGQKYFLTRCAGSGPEQSSDFDLALPPFDLDAYYAELESFRGALRFQELARVAHAGRNDPIYWVRRAAPEGAPRLLVVAGVHGDERASLLAVPRLLRHLADAKAAAWDVSVVVPANPVGAAHTSRYNASGCDVNRDFGAFDTTEARAIRDVFDRYEPDRVVATHEGPQDGFFLIATSAADAELARAMVSAVEGAGVSLARRSFLGLSLGAPGLSLEGWFTAAGKRMIRLGSLGTYLDSREVGAYTTESSWGSDDFEERIDSHVIAIQAILRSAPPAGTAGPEALRVGRN